MLTPKIEQRLRGLVSKHWDRPIGRSRHFSFLLDKNRVVSVGWNLSFKTHPIAKKFGTRFESLHSEAVAIIGFGGEVEELKKLWLINLRFNKVGELCMSAPCKKCTKMLRFFGIERAVYSGEDGDFHGINLNDGTCL